MRDRLYIVLVIVAFTSSCVTTHIVPKSDSPYVLAPTVDSVENLSKRVFLIADNQFHSMEGEQSWLQTGLADKLITPVTIRPPALDAHAPQLLRQVLRDMNDSLVVHLGDAANISCTNEFSLFLEVMNSEAKGRWVMAPGNHDSTYFGNYEKNSLSEWNDDCSLVRDHQFMDKAKFVRQYLRGLEIGMDDDSDKNAWPNQEIFYHPPDLTRRQDLRLWWYLDDETEHSWDSFVLQIIDISLADENKVWLIVLDTTHYKKDPKLLWSSAGIEGAIGSEQWQLVDDFVNSQEGTFLLAGHHPFGALDRKSRSRIVNLTKRGAVAYLSAHTHKGGWIVHEHHRSNSHILELNIGSIVDSKEDDEGMTGPTYRDMRLNREATNVVLRSRLTTLDESILGCDDKWLLPPRFYGYDPDPFNFKDTKISLIRGIIYFHDEELRQGLRTYIDKDTNKNIEFSSVELDGSENLKTLVKILLDLRESTEIDTEIAVAYQACQAYWASLREEYDDKHPYGETFSESESAMAVDTSAH